MSAEYGYIAIISATLSFVSVILIALIGVIYKSLVSDLKSAIKDINVSSSKIGKLEVEMRSVTDDIGRLVVVVDRMRPLETQVPDLIKRVDRHHADMEALRKACLDSYGG